MFADGRVARLTDFVELELFFNGKAQCSKSARDKGHAEEIRQTVEAIKTGKGSPIPFEQLHEVTMATVLIHESLSSGSALRVVPLHEFISSQQASEIAIS